VQLGGAGFSIDIPAVVFTFGGMRSPPYRVRRATLEDIGPLTTLWESMRFPLDDLARRITEFQVAEGSDGVLAGAVALQIDGKQGRIHSEAFTDFALAEELRPMPWERCQALATNHGLIRLWTRETAPFWHHSGLGKADPIALEKLPAPWQAPGSDWLTLKLREDIEGVLSLDKEFAVFMESEKARTNQAFRHAKALKMVATVLAFVLLVIVALGALYVMRNRGRLGR